MNHYDELDIQVQKLFETILKLYGTTQKHESLSFTGILEKFKSPAVIVKFIFLGGRRSMLGKFFDPQSSRQIVIKEPLPQKDRI